MYLIARPSGPPLYPPPPRPSISIFLREEEEEEQEVVEEEEEVQSLLAAEAGEDLWQMGPSHKTHSLGRNSSPRTFHRVPRFTWSERCGGRGVCFSACACVYVCVCWAPNMCRGSWGSLAACHGWHRAHLPQTCGALNHLLPPYTDTHTHTPPSLNARSSLRPPQKKKWNTDRHRPYDGYTCRQLCIPSNALGVLLWNWHTHTKGNYKRQTLCVPYVMPHWISGRNRQGLFLVLFLIPPPSPFWWMTLRCEYSGTWWSPVSLLQRLQVLQSDHQRCQAVVKLPNQNFFFSKKERSSLATSTIRRGFLF